MIAIIDYIAGNIASVGNALSSLGQNFIVTKNPREILEADKVIFPGVGSANSAMDDLRKKGLDQVIRKVKAPFLGICLGLQLMADASDEGNTKCLGIIKGRVKKFEEGLKVPQIGWNKVKIAKGNLLFRGVKSDSYFYFVNSYYLEINKYTVAEANYGVTFSAAINKDNFFATQFHPEKSGEIGIQVLANFCKL